MVNHLSDSTICSPNQNGFPMAQSTWLYGAGWGLRKLLNWVHLRYNGPDIYITEVRVRPCTRVAMFGNCVDRRQSSLVEVDANGLKIGSDLVHYLEMRA